MSMLVDTFIKALHHLERSGDPEGIVNLFAENATVANPLVQHRGNGRDSALSFWQSYRAAFKDITSEFRHIIEEDGIAFLEWVSEGTTEQGHFRYGGVSVIEHRSDEITAFRSYFDPRHIQEHRAGEKTVDHSEALVEAQRQAAEHRKEGGYQ